MSPILRHFSVLLAFAVLLLGLPGAIAAETNTSAEFSSPLAADLARLQQAEVSPAIMTAYAHAHASQGKLTESDRAKLLQLGVPPSVLLATQGYSPTTLSDRFFRLYFDHLFYQGRIYGVDFGLAPHLLQILKSDSATHISLKAYNRETLTSQVLSWGGLGLLVAGGIYGVATANPSYNSVNQTVSLSAAAVGGLSMIVGVFFHGAAYQSLYQTLLTYNQDLLLASKGGAP
ncbi:MAG: hypothetical protein HKM05_04995 [Spirochaetales bacterium]|nr:hypothetical protein [Spirochaetales bacterium]